MDQQKIGAFLKELRKEKGLTQDELGEKLYTTGRTISRWETGTNMPDLTMIVELSEFYGVSVGEIIDGERKADGVSIPANEDFKKAAEYADKEKREAERKTMSWIVGVETVALLVMVTIYELFRKESAGYLYGIVPENISKIIVIIVYELLIILASITMSFESQIMAVIRKEKLGNVKKSEVKSFIVMMIAGTGGLLFDANQGLLVDVLPLGLCKILVPIFCCIFLLPIVLDITKERKISQKNKNSQS